VALITSTISLYYYLNVIRLMVIVEPSEEVSNLPAQSTGQFAFSPVGLSVALTLVGTLVLGCMANPVMELSQKSVSSLIQPPTSVLGAQAPATVKPVQEPVVAHFN
jgi:NADH:ubiquinone oxidoreductase subunit 2 (subunit N)